MPPMGPQGAAPGQPPMDPSQQGQQPQPGNVPPEQLMALLAHLMQSGPQGGGPLPADGDQSQSLQQLLPMLMQMVQQTGQMPQQDPSANQPPPDPGSQLMQMLSSMGLGIGH